MIFTKVIVKEAAVEQALLDQLRTLGSSGELRVPDAEAFLKERA